MFRLFTWMCLKVRMWFAPPRSSWNSRTGATFRTQTNNIKKRILGLYSFFQLFHSKSGYSLSIVLRRLLYCCIYLLLGALATLLCFLPRSPPTTGPRRISNSRLRSSQKSNGFQLTETWHFTLRPAIEIRRPRAASLEVINITASPQQEIMSSRQQTRSSAVPKYSRPSTKQVG